MKCLRRAIRQLRPVANTLLKTSSRSFSTSPSASKKKSRFLAKTIAFFGGATGTYVFLQITRNHRGNPREFLDEVKRWFDQEPEEFAPGKLDKIRLELDRSPYSSRKDDVRILFLAAYQVLYTEVAADRHGDLHLYTDTDSIERLLRVVEDTDCRIVFFSGHERSPALHKILKEKLKKAGLKEEQFWGVTPPCDMDAWSIALFLRDISPKYNVVSWAAVGKSDFGWLTHANMETRKEALRFLCHHVYRVDVFDSAWDKYAELNVTYMLQKGNGVQIQTKDKTMHVLIGCENKRLLWCSQEDWSVGFMKDLETEIKI